MVAAAGSNQFAKVTTTKLAYDASTGEVQLLAADAGKGMKFSNTGGAGVTLAYDSAGANSSFDIGVIGSSVTEFRSIANKVLLTCNDGAVASIKPDLSVNDRLTIASTVAGGPNIAFGNTNNGLTAKITTGGANGTISISADPRNVLDSSEITFLIDGTEIGVMNASGDLTMDGDITASSDARLKENIETINSALDMVVRMRGVYYNKIGSTDRSVGVIAQEMEEVLPEVVLTSSREDGMKSVAYANIVGVLIEAIKELKADIEELKRG